MPPRATTLRADKVLHFIQLEIMNEWRLRLCETIRLIDRSPRPKKNRLSKILPTGITGLSTKRRDVSSAVFWLNPSSTVLVGSWLEPVQWL